MLALCGVVFLQEIYCVEGVVTDLALLPRRGQDPRLLPPRRLTTQLSGSYGASRDILSPSKSMLTAFEQYCIPTDVLRKVHIYITGCVAVVCTYSSMGYKFVQF